MSTVKLFFRIANVLVIVGGIHLGLVGFFGYDLIGALFGTGVAVRVVESLIGVGALYLIYILSTGHYAHEKGG